MTILLGSTFMWYLALFIMLYKMVLTFKCMDKTLVCDHSNQAVLSCDTIYYAVQGAIEVGKKQNHNLYIIFQIILTVDRNYIVQRDH